MRPPTLRPTTPAAPPPLQKKSESVANQPKKPTANLLDPPLGSPPCIPPMTKTADELDPREPASVSNQDQVTMKKKS